MESRFIEISEVQKDFLLQCIDTHQKTHGLGVSGNCFAMAKLLTDEFNKQQEAKIEELKKQEAI